MFARGVFSIRRNDLNKEEWFIGPIERPSPLFFGERLSATLTGWGGDVTHREAPAGAIASDAMENWHSAQPVRRRAGA